MRLDLGGEWVFVKAIPVGHPPAAKYRTEAATAVRLPRQPPARALIHRHLHRLCPHCLASLFPPSARHVRIMADRDVSEHDGAMPKNPPEPTQDHLRQRMNEHARARRPQLDRVQVRYRGGFAYVDGYCPVLSGRRVAGPCQHGGQVATPVFG